MILIKGFEQDDFIARIQQGQAGGMKGTGSAGAYRNLGFGVGVNVVVP